MRSGVRLRQTCLWFGSGWAVIHLLWLLWELDDRTLLLARNTLALAAGACLVAVPAGTCFAILLSRTDLPGRRWIRLVWISMLFVPLYLQAAAWDAGFGQLGWLSPTALPANDPWLRRWVAAIGIHGLAGMPWVVLMVGVAARRSEPELEQDALLYRTSWQVMRQVTLRRAAGGIGLATLWVAMSTATDMTVTDLYQIRTFAEEVYINLQMPATASGLPELRVALLTASLLAGVLLAAGGTILGGPVHVPARRPLTFHLGRWRWPLAIGTAVVLLAAVGLPLGHLLMKAGRAVQVTESGFVPYWSAEKLLRLLVPLPASYESSVLWRFQREAGWTLLLGTCVATCGLVLSLPLAWWARRGGWSALPALLPAVVGLAVSGPLIGVAIIWLFTRSSQPWCVWLYDRTLLAPILAVTIRYLPLGILVCWVAFASLPRSVLEAAAVDGARPLRRFLRIGLPQRRAALAVAWLLLFALASGELAASILVMPLGVTTLPIRVFGLLHAGADDQVSAISLLSVIAFLCGGLVISALGHIALRPAAGADRTDRSRVGTTSHP